jgi:hypothetical protein
LLLLFIKIASFFRPITENNEKLTTGRCGAACGTEPPCRTTEIPLPGDLDRWYEILSKSTGLSGTPR